MQLTTPWHLLLMMLFFVVAVAAQHKHIWKWILLVFPVGFAVEWLGVHKSILFGHYAYTTVLGFSWQQIPLLIAFNWVFVIYASASLAQAFTANKILAPLSTATIATFFDWVMEPAAIKLHYWQWFQVGVPLSNYVSWWLISLLLAILWQFLKYQFNQFAVNLLLIQLLFFAIIQSHI
jgi:putative membrane protein